MKIALLHYHLKTGGVATVVRQQARAIEGVCRVCVMVGETTDASPPPNTVVVPGLAYSQSASDPEATADAVLAAVNATLNGPCDVLHVHNPTLAKNVNFLKILAALQHRGARMLLQIHDFAEDGRPQNYSSEAYPHNCHYAVINTRDYRFLQGAGLNPAGLHLLPNMVGGSADAKPTAPVAPLVLYPVRAIRRKNLGEAILLSLFMAPQDHLGITLPPNSAADWPSYRSWQEFAGAHQLRIQFELGNRFAFGSLMRAAKYVITTSIAEGFGFSFLEPWIFGKPLLGRKLPAVCRDFENRGLNLSHLYTRLRIPLPWLDQKEFYRKWSAHLRHAGQRYNAHISQHRVRMAFRTLTAAGNLDFGLLDEAAQQALIVRLAKSEVLRERLQAYNPFLKYFTENALSEEIIMDNQRVIQRHYSIGAYRRQLLEIYTAVRQKGVSHRIEKTRLLAAFLRPTDCSMLRWDLEGG